VNAELFESEIFGAGIFDGWDLRGGTLRGLLVLAEDAPPTDGLMSMMPALIIILGLFYFLILRPQKNKEQTFRSMIDNLKEKDRVVTIGGIHGVITNIGKDSEIVTVRIDESSGTKIRIGTSAIARVVTDENNKEK
jgi:preprotein translocase subunit YajC